jgi:hypothetical protein
MRRPSPVVGSSLLFLIAVISWFHHWSSSLYIDALKQSRVRFLSHSFSVIVKVTSSLAHLSSSCPHSCAYPRPHSRRSVVITPYTLSLWLTEMTRLCTRSLSVSLWPSLASLFLRRLALSLSVTHGFIFSIVGSFILPITVSSIAHIPIFAITHTFVFSINQLLLLAFYPSDSPAFDSARCATPSITRRSPLWKCSLTHPSLITLARLRTSSSTTSLTHSLTDSSLSRRHSHFALKVPHHSLPNSIHPTNSLRFYKA